MLKKTAAILMLAAILTVSVVPAALAAGQPTRNMQPRSDGYDGYLEYIHTSYYYLLATDYFSGSPLSARNVCSYQSVSNTSQWLVRCACHNGDITFPVFHATGDYTYAYEDYEHTLSGAKLVARPNSNVSGVNVSGTFYGR